MATTANAEIDPILKKAVRLLHSSNPNSATEMRLLLDELIKQRLGPEKMLANTLSAKHAKKLEELESNFPGLVVTPPAAPPKPDEVDQVDEVINLTNSPGSATAEESNLKDFGDLNCCVCGEMMITATNRLIECSNCSTLYHQECHKPPITDQEASEDQEHNWICDNCTNKPSTSKSANVITPTEEQTLLPEKSAKLSANSSRSSSPFYKQESSVSTRHESGSSSSSKHHHHHKSSHSSKSSKSSSKDGSSKRKSHK